jgi:putative two-component system response regulator
MPHENAVSIIEEGRGSHFDPDMVDAFVMVQEDFRRIAAQFADGEHEMQTKSEYLSKAIGKQ